MKSKLERFVKDKLAELRRKYQKYVLPYISLVIVVLFFVAIFSSYKVSSEYYQYVAESEHESAGADNGANKTYVVAKALENTAVSLTGDVILPIGEVDKLPHEGGSASFWFWVYIISRIIFPAVCLIFIVGIVKKMFRYSLIWVPHLFKTEIAIFGYNDRVGEVIDHSDMDDYKVYLVLNEKLDDEIEEKLFGNGISIIYEPFEKKEYYKYRTLKRCKYFLLMEVDAMRNVALYMAFCQNEKNNRIVKKKQPKFYLQCSDLSTEKLMKRYSDRMISIMKDDNQMFISDVELFSYMGVLAQKTYAHLPLYKYNLQNEGVGNDVHLLIAGLSEFGLAMLSQALTLGVFASDSRILVDIVDHDFDNTVRQVQNLMLQFRDKAHGCVDGEVPESEGKLWRLVLGKESDCSGDVLADGILEVRVWRAEVLSDRYIDVLEKICEEAPLTYAASCFNFSEINIRCVDKLSDVLRKKGEAGRIPLVVNFQHAKGIREVIEDKVKNYYWFSDVYFTVSDKSDIGLAEIINPERDERVRTYSALYNEMYDAVNGKALKERSDEQIRQEAAYQWNRSTLYGKQSTINQVNAEEVKKFIVGRSYEGTKSEAVSAIEDVLATMHEKQADKKDGGTGGSVLEQMNRLIKNQPDNTAYNATVEEWAKAEHRRWCYYMLLSGYRFDNERDDNGDLRHNCIRRWADMDRDEAVARKKVYDLIAFLMIIDQSKDRTH